MSAVYGIFLPKWNFHAFSFILSYIDGHAFEQDLQILKIFTKTYWQISTERVPYTQHQKCDDQNKYTYKT